MPRNISKALVAEAIGTFTLCFAGVLAITAADIVNKPTIANLASIGLAHGLAIGVMIAALGAISGGHFNPAVTFGFVVTGRLPIVSGLLYWAAQLIGALIAGLILVAVVGGKAVAAGTPNLADNVPVVNGIIIEAVLTFFLVLVIFGTAVDERAPKSIFPLAIGLTIALDIMAGGPLTGAAMNPARTFGPALASGMWTNHLVYWVGPLIGGAAAALLEHHFLIEGAPSPETAARGGPAPSEERGTLSAP
jgi:MIP family channel proteins